MISAIGFCASSFLSLFSLFFASGVSLLFYHFFKGEQKSRVFAQTGFLIHFQLMSFSYHTQEWPLRSQWLSTCTSLQAGTAGEEQQNRAVLPQDTPQAPRVTVWQFPDKAADCLCIPLICLIVFECVAVNKVNGQQE